MNNHNGVQQPLFAPVNQSNKFEGDIDLSDIFADYLNEGPDPLTTFSNFGGGMSLAPAAASTGSVILPTGGIRTAYHAGNLPNMNQTMMQQQQHQVQQQQQFQQQQVQQMQTHQQIQEHEHIQKKARTENMQQFQQFQQQAAVPTNLSTTGSGITGRLGFDISGGQLQMPSKNVQAAATPSAGGVQLPIGVGIRVGGAVAQAAAAAAGNSGGLTLNHVQYGANRGADQGGNVQVPLWSSANTTGGLSDQAMAERRQRNREHAKRSRVRKKFLLESLQAEVRELQTENQNLRTVVQIKIPQHAQKIISECCAKNPLFDDSSEQNGDKEKNKGVELANSDFGLIQSLTSGQQNFVLSDPRLPDNPIVYASEGFYHLTGYTREQVLGRNCRFLQGPGTDPKAVDVIRTAVANGTDATACLLNYKADGTPFWNQFFVAALRDSDNCIVNFVGVQCAIDPGAGASALEDKVNSVLPLATKDGAERK